jgi:hypothetical protein
LSVRWKRECFKHSSLRATVCCLDDDRGTRCSLSSADENHFIEESIDRSAARQYPRGMVIQSLREFNRAVPFVPYEIQMAGGAHYQVPHPDFILISPRGSFVIVTDQEERPHHLNSLLIERASLLNGKRRNRKRP